MMPANDIGNKNDLIIVYQMPKVASTSIGDALKKHFPITRVTHYISAYSLPIYKQMLDYEGQGTLPFQTVKSIVSIANATNEINSVYHTALASGQRIKIITGVREPMDMSVSAIFHNLYTITAFYEWMYEFDPEATVKIFIKMVLKFFENTYRNVPCENAVEMLMRMGINLTDWWFEKEFNPTLNIDLTQYDFDDKQGYALISSGQLDILVFRFEDRFALMQEAIGRFVGIPGIEIPQENVAENKNYAFLYKAVKKSIEFPEHILDIKYNIPYTRHFYTQSEIAAFRNKWSQKE